MPDWRPQEALGEQMSFQLRDVVRGLLANPETGWSMGSFGAIAEFHQDAGEMPLVDHPNQLTRATARGAVRINPESLGRALPIAYEIPSSNPRRWSHGIALCFQTLDARRCARTMLAELGPDQDAIRVEDRQSVLFDMGLGLPQAEFCIRTSDPYLLEALRAASGQSVFDKASHAMPMILRNHPHRVALTNLGRVEVFQKIGGPDTGGISPPGPHTHVLPKLLRSGRTHPANIPIPDGLTPCAYVHPGNPVVGSLGEDRSFDARLHGEFQALLEAFGPKGLLDTKRRLIDHLKAGKDDRSFAVPDDRHHRAVTRVALRQLARAQEDRQDLELTLRINAWRARFDQMTGPAADDLESARG
jgi:hypothetical protein